MRTYLSESQSRALYERRRFTPSSFGQLVRWFTQAWRAEVPDEIHAGGIEKTRVGEIERGEPVDGGYAGPARVKEADPGGGNRLGAPAYRPDFRAFVFGSAAGTEYAQAGERPDLTESYSTPMRWTVEFLERSRHPLLAAVLRRLGRTGEWRGISVTCSTCTTSVTLPDEYAEAIARDALGMAVKHYREEPEARAV